MSSWLCNWCRPNIDSKEIVMKSELTTLDEDQDTY